MRIRRTTTILLLLLSLVPLVVIGGIAYKNAEEAIQTNLGLSFQRIATATVDKIDRSLYEVYRNGRIWADLEFMQDVVSGDLDGRISSFLKKLSEEHKDFSGLCVSNERGEVVAADDAHYIGHNLHQTDFFQNTIQGDIYIRDVQRSELNQRFEVVFSFPIKGRFPPDQVIGVFHIGWSVNTLFDMTGFKGNENGDDFQGQIIIINKEGLVISAPQDTPGYIFQHNLIKRGLRSALFSSQGQHGYLIEKGADNAEVLVGYDNAKGYRDFPGMGWSALVIQETKTVFPSIEHLRFLVFSMGALVSISVIIFSLIASHRITAPLLELIRAVKKVAKGDFDTRINVSASADEISQLADAFNRMTEDLYQTTVSKEYVNNIIASMTNSLVVLTPEGKIRMVNEAACQLLGYREGELLGKSFEKLLVEEQDIQRLWATILKDRKPIRNMERIYRAKNGQEIPILFSASAMHDKDDKVLGIVCAAQDISRRKEAEQERMRLATALDAVGEGILITDTKGVIQYVNPAFERMTGYKTHEVIGQTPRILKSGHHDGAFYQEMWETLLRNEMWRASLINRKKDETLFDAEETIAPVKDASGKVINFVAVLHDITERKKAEDALKKANEDLTKSERAVRALYEDLEGAHASLKDREATLENMYTEMQKANEELRHAQRQLVQSEKLASIGQLAAGVAHEINNPLGFINSNLQTLEEYMMRLNQLLETMGNIKKAIQEEDLKKAALGLTVLTSMEESINLDFLKEDIKNLIKESQSGADRIRRIVIDLRTFAREDEEVVEMISLEEIVESILNIVHNEIKYKAELKKEYAKLPLVKCNSRKLGQVFVNLLVNAAQAIKEKGTIGIKTYEKEGYACVAITDTGQGIAEEDLNRIFDPFFTTKPIGEGTGLGLSISYDIIKQHGGDILVESDPGKGTTFTVILPLAEKKES